MKFDDQPDNLEFDLTNPDSRNEFIIYLEQSYSSHFRQSDIKSQDKYIKDSIKWAKSGAFSKVKILDDGEMIWTARK